MDPVQFKWTWHPSETITDASGSTSWQAVHLLFKEVKRSAEFQWPSDRDSRLFIQLSSLEHHPIQPQQWGSEEALRLLLDCLSATIGEQGTALSLVVPQCPGYIVRPDIIPLRLLDCPLVARVSSFATFQHRFEGEPLHPEHSARLPSIFAASAGGVIVEQPGTVDRRNAWDEQFASLDQEIRNRLSFPWLSAQSRLRRTLAIVDGGISSPEHGGTGESIYTAALALGIDMVVLDSPNHWVNGSDYVHWRKAAIPLECPLHPDAEFPDRIVEAVRSYDGQIDGIVTFRDHYKRPVAEAAVRLGLSTYSPSAYEIATDKFKSSVSEGHHAFVASSAAEGCHIVREHGLAFPLIIKPTNGFLSEGVVRVENLAQFEAGVEAIHTERHGSEFVIEKYCSGPEVDANLVLCDGELIFFEVSDDFPKGADVNGQASVNTFIELANVLPSKLPEAELTMLGEALTRSLQRMGFSDGFYHLEARVENSRMHYTVDIRTGVLDLTERDRPPTGAPSAWLIEVNPRPPGIQASAAVKHTYGVDYFALALLFALGDKERVRQLSHPFLQGPQYWCEMVFIPVEKGGVYDSGDVCEELRERRPDLAACVSASFCFLRKGDLVVDPSSGVNSWVAYFNVFSRESREHVLDLAEDIRREVRYSII